MASDAAPESTPLDVLALTAARGGQPEHDALINAFLDADALERELGGDFRAAQPAAPSMIESPHR